MAADRTAPSPTIAATALGPVEYGDVGDGAPVLVVHGTPGGYDQAAAMAQFLGRHGGFRAILPSRPGYLGTPLAGQETIDTQADLHDALLHHLGVERVAVLCWSGGGPSTYRLAVRHPERVSAIVSLDAVSKAYPRPAQPLDERLMMRTGLGNWIMNELAKHAPEQLISSTLAAEGELDKEQLDTLTKEVFADEHKRQFVLDLDATVRQGGTRKAGFENDLDQFEAIDSLELDRIGAPTLVVQGGADTDVTPDYSDFAVAAIPGAELLTLDNGTHLAFFTHPDAERAQERALRLLASAI
jgi:pimeloyl-ACP methyl ester carboxylesterase